MEIWILSPFLLALLLWWVATRRHPEDKEKWTWLAFGLCAGAVLMFTLTFLSQRKVGGSGDPTDTSTPPSAGVPKARLDNDSAVEILPAVRIRQDSSAVVGSLQITLLDVTATTARVQLEPRAELELFNTPEWSYSSGTGSANASVTRTAVEVTLGEHLYFGFRGYLYRLGLLEVQPPLWGLAPENTRAILPSHAVIRLVREGASSAPLRNPGDMNTRPGKKGEAPGR